MPTIAVEHKTISLNSYQSIQSNCTPAIYSATINRPVHSEPFAGSCVEPNIPRLSNHSNAPFLGCLQVFRYAEPQQRVDCLATNGKYASCLSRRDDALPGRELNR